MKIMKLVFTLSHGCHQTRGFKNLEVLRDRLARQAHLVFHRQSCAQLKERLTISSEKFVKDRPTRRRSDRLKDVAHNSTIGKS